MYHDTYDNCYFICCGEFCNDIKCGIIYEYNTYCDMFLPHDMYLDSCVLRYTEIYEYIVAPLIYKYI